mmetsp:Transcript_93528/g.273875  ORF Transcript_93528/g.273875 Transcript_93528/m.273875 type:complete len:935 (+) Transcript_93528:84-2888(+)
MPGHEPLGETTPLLKEDLDFKNIVQEEHDLLRQKREGRGAQGGGKPFSLAFSGGGIRAAAFQSGVLWRLAQAGLLKDVEYLAAVSGGAYIASSFASHLLAEKPPVDEQEVDAWYQAVVAKAISRMQRNAGGFVRDPGGDAWSFPKDGSGSLPRALDLPTLAVALVSTLLINPLQLLVVYLVPITETIMLFFGAALRAAFCAPSGPDRWYVLMAWSPFGALLRAFEGSVLLTFALWLISKLPCFQLIKSEDGKTSRSMSYLVLYSARACMVRVTAVLLVVLLLIWGIPHTQIWDYQMQEAARSVNQTRQSFCIHYMHTKGAAIDQLISGDGARAMGCANFYHGKPWFQDKVLMDLTGRLPRPTSISDDQLNITGMGYDVMALRALHRLFLMSSNSIVSAFFSLLLIVILAAIILLPLFPSLVFSVLSLAGPVAALMLAQLFVQYRIYGPLTGQPLYFQWLPFNHAHWDVFMGGCLLVCVVMIPFYNDFQRIWHWYYLRSLQMNFFANGRDLSLESAGLDPRCPLLLYTGTVSDYKRPGSDSSISEISFTPLHTGSEATRYVRTPPYRSLAKCTALTAAGCLDAISLSMTNHVRFRFWLELLNLSWGDFVLFKRRHKFAAWVSAFRGNVAHERALTWLFYRGPNLVLTLLFGVIFTAGWYLAKISGNRDCQVAKEMVAFSVFASSGLIMLSFFAFMPGLGWLMFSPQYRQVHQATMFHFQAERAPGLLYVTDGGVQDCTGVVQLLRRHCERILLVLAAADPHDELGVLRTAMDVAAAEKLAAFYDPEEPRRDVRELLEEFALDKAMPFLHIGIRYGWGSTRGAEIATGTLFIVKNRLPAALEKLPVEPLLTEEEIRSDSWGPRQAVADCEALAGLQTSDLGGLGCCDCCHRRGCNCGGKFPHLTGANYLWLTPQLFSSLCRLGHELSEEVAEKLAR